MTGFPSIDKPWQKYYEKESINVSIPKMTMYQMAWESNCENLDECCLTYYGREITYRGFFENVNKAAAKFYRIGIRKGDIVTIVSVCTPETLYSIYALNYIGAAANMLYMTVSEQEIIRSAEKTESKILLISDLVAEKANYLANKMTMPIIILPVADSMPFGIRQIFILNSKFPKTDLPVFNKWIKSEEMETDFPKCTDSEATAIIVYTSGTTGSPKGVMLSSDSLNSIAVSCQQSGKNYRRGETFLDAIPPFLGFGISMTHLGICTGIVLQLVLNPEPDEIAKAFMKLKSNRLVYGPRLADAMIKHAKGRLDWLVEFTGGGEAISLEKEKEINDFLSEHGAPAKYTTGYGMTEAASALAFNLNHACRLGSAGIPLPTVNVKVMDGNKEQPYHEIGELCFSSPSIMQGYYKDPAATQNVIETDSMGIRWLHTGDMGYVDEDGFIFITGRMKRIYTVFGKDGNLYKLFPQRIEEFIVSLPNVADCSVIVQEDLEKAHAAIAFVCMADSVKDKEAALSDITISIKRELPEHLWPKSIRVVDAIPLTTSGKVDYRALELLISNI